MATWRNSGRELAGLTWADTVALDEFHAGGRAATLALARLAGVAAGMTVLDVGSGLGGPARTLAATCGARVTGLEQSGPYLVAAQRLTAHLGPAGQVRFVRGKAPDLPFGADCFDVVWLQHLLPVVAARGRFFAQIRRILRPGGRLALHEPCAGPGGPAVFPVPWADEPALSALSSPAALRAQLGDAGLRVGQWQDVTEETLSWFWAQRRAGPAGPLNLSLILGEGAGEKVKNLVRNLEEERVRIVRAVLA